MLTLAVAFHVCFCLLMLMCSEKRTLGLFWLNTAETWIDISSNTADRVSCHSVCVACP